MSRPANGFELLDILKKQNGKSVQNHSEMSEYLEAKAREKGIPYSGQFELTPFCNFDCKMCYVHLNPEQIKGYSILSVEVWKNLIHQAWEMGMCAASLTGGECLAYPGFEDVYLYLHDLGCEAAILTNGYLLDDRRIDFFRRHKPRRIQVTLYGWNDDVYERVTGRRAFETVIGNVRSAINAGLPVSLTITPNRFLGEDVLETIKLAKDLRKYVFINAGLFSPREETGRFRQKASADDELYLKIYRLMHQLEGEKITEIDEDDLPPCGGPDHECSECGVKCGGGRSGFTIDWKGTVTPCNRLSVIHADALSRGFKAAWSKVNKQAKEWPRVPECEGCAYDKVCANCAGNILQFGEAGKQPIRLCEQTRFLVRNGVKHIPDCE